MDIRCDESIEKTNCASEALDEFVSKLSEEDLLNNEYHKALMAKSINCINKLFSHLQDEEKEILIEYEELLYELLNLYKNSKCKMCVKTNRRT